MSNRYSLFSITIKDCIVETFTVGGAGGGGKDTSNTGVRIRHPLSGACGVGVDHRSQLKNKQDAFKRMANSKEFRKWLRIETARRQGHKPLEEVINDWLTPSLLRVEKRTEKGWELLNDSEKAE